MATKKRGLVEAEPNIADINDTSLGKNASSVPNKKPRKRAVTAKSLGLTKDEFESIKTAPIKKRLKEIVKTLARQVDADWHDGYEEQAETKAEWFNAIEDPLQAVLDIGVGKRTALLQCNEVLKIVSDSFYDLLACPCRCDTKEELSDMDQEFDLDLPWGGTFHAKSGSQEEAWSYVWVALLRVHASLEGTDEELLLRCIKDASDNMNGADMALPGVLYNNGDEDFDDYNPKDGKDAPCGKVSTKLFPSRDLETEVAVQCVHLNISPGDHYLEFTLDSSRNLHRL